MATLSVPSLANWTVNNLNGIACTAAANCWAVGGTLNPAYRAPATHHRTLERGEVGPGGLNPAV